jgi:cytochrome oxidase Cu insertion factor (SCO1/SenC/PrrC family)
MRFNHNHWRASGPLIPMMGCALLALSAGVYAGVSPMPADGAPLSRPAGTVRRSVTEVKIPELKMVREDGAAVSLDRELNDGRPVVVNFIYTSCTTICPMSSQEFSLLQERLGKDRDRVHLVSISIDPEQDTPSRLRSYAQHFPPLASTAATR